MLAQATIVGRSHRLMNHNCQDFAITGSPKAGYGYGIVLDGCGGKYREAAVNGERPKFLTHPSQNEVGARVMGQFAAQWLERHLARQASLACLADKLQLAAELFLKAFVMSMGYVETAERLRFVHTNLLATLLGFAFTPNEGCFFWAGDGYLRQNGDITGLDYENRPPYLAYNLLNGKGRATQLQHCLFPMDETVTGLAVATDGWQSEQFSRMERPQSSLALQRWVNVEAQQRGRFEDDGAIALWVRDDD